MLCYTEQVEGYYWGDGWYVSNQNIELKDSNIYEQSENLIITPQYTSSDLITIDLGYSDTISYIGYQSPAIVISGVSYETPIIKYILETDISETPIFESEFNNIPYFNCKVNFVELKEDFFSDTDIIDNVFGGTTASEFYSTWEYVDSHNFRAKPKNFIKQHIAPGGGQVSDIRPAYNYILLPYTCVTLNTNLYDTVKVWNFYDSKFLFELTSPQIDIPYGEENEKGFTVQPKEFPQSGFILQNSEKIKAVEPLFNTNPYPLNDDTALGLYIYGLPIGVTASVEQNTETQELTITLSGTATTSADIDLHPSITYLYSEEQNPMTIGQTIGDFDKESIFALTSTISGITFKKQIRTSSSGSSNNTTIATPTSNHKSGNVSIGTKLELSTSYKDGKIYYTLDGTTPSLNSTLYTGAIPIDKSMTLKYIVVSNGKASPVVSQTFTVELPKTNWKENSAQIRYIAGYEDNTFKPDTAISRYEMLTALHLLLELEKSDSIKEFPDVPTEYKDIVSLFASSGIVEGYDDGEFKGEQGLTRAEFVKILSIIFGTEKSDSTSLFSDVSGHWAESYIADFAKHGYLQGYDDGLFHPNDIITRAEFVAIINRIIKSNSEPLNNTFIDLSPDHWAYADITKATLK